MKSGVAKRINGGLCFRIGLYEKACGFDLYCHFIRSGYLNILLEGTYENKKLRSV